MRVAAPTVALMLFALDQDGELTHAHAAVGDTFTCHVCAGPVARRAGRYREPYFAHTEPGDCPGRSHRRTPRRTPPTGGHQLALAVSEPATELPNGDGSPPAADRARTGPRAERRATENLPRALRLPLPAAETAAVPPGRRARFVAGLRRKLRLWWRAATAG